MRTCRYFLAILIYAWIWAGCGSHDNPQQGWTPQILSDSSIYLPDFSYAGYHWGEDTLPRHAATLNVTQFGAIPNDGEDDSDAILKAVAAAGEQSATVVVKFPPGRFILKKILFIDRSDFVLQGSGSGAQGTTIYLPVPMQDVPLPQEMIELQEYLVKNNKRVNSGELFSPFSWTGGFIWARMKHERIYPYLPEKDQPAPVLTNIGDGKRGSHHFVAEQAGDLRPGSLVKILWFNKEGEQSSLLRHLYGEGDFPIGERHWGFPERPLIQQIVTIARVDGNQVSIKEPLLHDLRPEWGTVLSPAKMLTEVGIEHMRIEFPDIPYAGHHLEHGYNAIYLTSVAHAWIRDVQFFNSDNSILSDECAFITIENVQFKGRRSHYNTHFGKVNHLLAKGLLIDCPAEHSISFNTFSKASVYSDVSILQTPSLDQHCGTNHQNLFDNIRVITDALEPDLFKHGGAGYWKPTHGKFNTFWNIEVQFNSASHSDSLLKIKGIDDGPSAIWVGFYGNRPIRLNYGPNAYVEGQNQSGISVPSLYQHQLKQRLLQWP